MHVVLNGKVLEAALPDVAVPTRAVMTMVLAYMSIHQATHVRRKCFDRFRPHDEMEVRGHEAVRQEANGSMDLRVFHQFKKRSVIALFSKDSRPIVPAIEHVMGETGRCDAPYSWHADATEGLKEPCLTCDGVSDCRRLALGSTTYG
jgi:hypothetical protein